jgi:sterol 3beta-glucosyltransferase
LRPLLALANELAVRRATAVLAFPPFARALAERTPFQFCSIGPDLAGLRDHINYQWASNAEVYQSPEEMLRILTPFREALGQTYVDLKAACRGADLLIAGAVQPIARALHETTGIPFVSVQMAHFGGSGGPSIRYAGAEIINPFRRRLGLAELKDPLTADANSPQMSLYAISRHLYPQPPDWPKHYHVTGFFWGDQVDGSPLSQELEEFLADGRPFIVVTFGSMVHGDRERHAELLNRAIGLTGYRAIIQDDAAGRQSGDRKEIFWTGFVPHHVLFPRAACIVLHGGAGTSAATFRSGVPGVFVPHGDCYDQRYWARLAMDAGCALPHIDYANLTAEKLSSAILQTIGSSALREAAQNLSQKIRREPGVQYAAELIAQFVRRMGLCRTEELSPERSWASNPRRMEGTVARRPFRRAAASQN